MEDFEGIAPVHVLKHCTTRWLSLERAVIRLLLLWDPLDAYFDREAERSGNSGTDRVRRIEKQLSKPITKLFAQFVAYALKPLNKFNIALQSDASKIGTMQKDIQYLLRSFLANFVKPEVLATTPSETVHEVDFTSRDNHVSDDELGIGTAARLHMIECEDDLEGN